MKKLLTNNYGYSLIDLTASLLFLALVITVSIPVLSEIKNRFDLKRNTEELKALIEKEIIYSGAASRDIKITIAKTVSVSKDNKATLVWKPAKGITLAPHGTIHIHSGLTLSPYSIRLKKGAAGCKISISLRGRVQTKC
ncbi:MAG: hypothetical protein D6719_01065 [Candidatus Dadabacteria bacterium]|nr:MAG: hypothetical protein D6719_01065 [Candidatus Dadabacteria bacterium]